mgnify:FL=1
MKKSKVIIAVLMFLFTMLIAPIPTFAEDLDLSTANIDIEGVKFNYNPGDKPEAKAYKCDPWEELYDIEYEYWEEMDISTGEEPVPVKYWYSDESKNNALAEDKKITTFEEGKTYMYSISLKAKGENKFGSNTSVRVNGTKISSVSVPNSGSILFVTAVETIKPVKPIQIKHIDVIELNNATVSFNVNDKPVFTGKTPDESSYIYQFECWQAKDGAGITSAEFFNQGYENLITAFESGKEYQYILYFKAKEGYAFTRDTKLKINGKYYNYKVSDWEEETDVDEFQTTWRMYPDLTMIPTSSEQPTQDTVKEIKSTNGSITFEKEVSKNYTLDIKQVEISKILKDKNVKYLVDINVLENGQKIEIKDTKMKIRIALPEDLKGYSKYEIVYVLNDEMKETIQATIEDGYIVFETLHLSEYGIVATGKSSGTNVENPKTGDNITLYIVTTIFSIVGLIGSSMIIYRKKQNN